MSAPLYQLIEQHRALDLLSEEGEIDPQTIADTLEGLEGDIELKAQSVAMFIRNLQADAGAIEEAAKQMVARAKRIRMRAEAVHQYLMVNMQASGIRKISCAYFTLSIKKNPHRVEVLDAESIPDRFRVWPDTPPPSIDKKALLEALKAGETVPGAALAQDERLEIKV